MRLEDRICRLYKELIPYVIPDYPQRSKNLLNVEVISGYDAVHIHYVFDDIRSGTFGGSSLHCQILFTLDKFLSWYDLIEESNNKLKIHIHCISKHTTEDLTYFELMDIAMSHYPYSYRDHPKLSQFFQWKR
jgi:hypothetical protein